MNSRSFGIARVTEGGALTPVTECHTVVLLHKTTPCICMQVLLYNRLSYPLTSHKHQPIHCLVDLLPWAKSYLFDGFTWWSDGDETQTFLESSENSEHPLHA